MSKKAFTYTMSVICAAPKPKVINLYQGMLWAEDKEVAIKEILTKELTQEQYNECLDKEARLLLTDANELMELAATGKDMSEAITIIAPEAFSRYIDK